MKGLPISPPGSPTAGLNPEEKDLPLSMVSKVITRSRAAAPSSSTGQGPHVSDASVRRSKKLPPAPLSVHRVAPASTLCRAQNVKHDDDVQCRLSNERRRGLLSRSMALFAGAH